MEKYLDLLRLIGKEMSFDTIADLFSSLNNAKAIGNTKVEVAYSKIKFEILKLLEHEGVLPNFEIREIGKNKKVLDVKLVYFKNLPTFLKISPKDFQI